MRKKTKRKRMMMLDMEAARFDPYARNIELSGKMHTREMKFFAAMLGDGLFDTLRYARPNLVEVFKGTFIYSESDRMAIFKWKEGTIPEMIFSSKGHMDRDDAEIRCRCGRFFSEQWADDYVKTFRFDDINTLEERFCDKCKENEKQAGSKLDAAEKKIARLEKENKKVKAENEKLKRRKLECDHDDEYEEGVFQGVYQMIRHCKKCGRREGV